MVLTQAIFDAQQPQDLFNGIIKIHQLNKIGLTDSKFTMLPVLQHLKMFGIM